MAKEIAGWVHDENTNTWSQGDCTVGLDAEGDLEFMVGDEYHTDAAGSIPRALIEELYYQAVVQISEDK